jgi:Holliday junction resolvasome RuvABC endonuclease subunit
LRLLALDLATVTGFALWAPGMRLPNYGTLTFAAEIGAFACDMKDAFDDAFKAWKIDEIFVEAPLSHGRTQAATTLKLIGAQVIVRMLAYKHGIKVTAVPVSTWRKHFIGAGRAPKAVPKPKRRKWLKATVMAACVARGWPTEDDNAADALGLLSYACHQRGLG